MSSDNISNNHGVVTIDGTSIQDFVRKSDEPIISNLSLGLRAPAGTAVGDLFRDPSQQRRRLRRVESPLTLAVDMDVLVVTSELPRWEASSFSSHRNELAGYYQYLGEELSKIAKPGVDVALVPESVRRVTYGLDRGLHNESALRDVYEYWRVHQHLDPLYSECDFDTDATSFRDEHSFGWSTPECELRLRWISKAVAIADGRARNALIRCEVSCNPTGLASLLKRTGGAKVEEIAGLGAEVMEAMISSVQLSNTEHDDSTSHLGELLDPLRFFLGFQR